MGTYNGCLLIPLTALQVLSYVSTVALLVRPLQGFTLGYINAPPSPSPVLLPPPIHILIEAAIHAH